MTKKNTKRAKDNLEVISYVAKCLNTNKFDNSFNDDFSRPYK